MDEETIDTQIETTENVEVCSGCDTTCECGCSELKAEDSIIETADSQDSESTITEPTDEQKADPDFDIIEAASEEDRVRFFAELENEIKRIYMNGDSLIAMRIRPGALETFMEWYATFQLSDDPARDSMIRQQIKIIPDKEVPTVSLETHAQLEAGWLYKYFSDKGLFKLMEVKGAPIRINPSDLKLLFLIDLLNEGKSNIIQASAGPSLKFDPSSLNMKTR